MEEFKQINIDGFTNYEINNLVLLEILKQIEC